LIECDDLTVNHGVLRKLRERSDDRGIPAVEVVVVPRSQMDGTVSLERNGAIPVELELIEPLLPGREDSVRNSSMGSMNLAATPCFGFAEDLA
jgi:hypothetical protein